MISAVLWLIGLVLFVSFGLLVFKGAPYVPSHRRQVQNIFTTLQVGEHDCVVDVGAGDGVVLRQAAEKGATAVGYELNPILYAIARLLCRSQPRITLRLADYWQVKFPAKTTIVYAFSVARDMQRLERLVQREATRLGRPLLFVSYGGALKNRTPFTSTNGFYVYRISALQADQT